MLEVVRACMRSAAARLRHSRGRQQWELRIEPGTVFTTSCDARIISTSEDGAALLDISRGVCCKLDVVADTIWKEIASSSSGATVEAILQRLEEVFKVNRQEIQEETTAYLLNLEAQGLLLRNRCT